MKIILRRANKILIQFFNSIGKLPLQPYNPFKEILEETFNSVEYEVDVMETESVCIINESIIEVILKNKDLDRKCNIDDNVLFKNDRLERIVSMKEKEDNFSKCKSNLRSIVIKNDKENDYKELLYFIYWNEKSNCIDYYIKMNIASKESFSEIMEENQISEELISRLLYKKQRFKNVKGIVQHE